MHELDESTKEKNYTLFLRRLESVGVDTSILNEKYGTLIKESPMSAIVASNVAYDGALLDKVLRHITPKALQLREVFDESIRPSKEQVIKVCLLHRLGNCVMFTKNTNEWEVNNRGIKYTYVPTKVALKSGMRSILICNECNIQLTEEEIESMVTNERNDDDAQAKFFSSPLAMIIKMANEIINTENRLVKE